jgi:Zn-dependent peptidase ImmA (M78 family)
MSFTDSIVPYRSIEKLEDIAKNYLESFEEDLLQKPQETNISDFIEIHLQLGFQALPISPDGKTLGYMVFKPTGIDVFVGSNKEKKHLFIDKETVVVDSALSDNDEAVGRFRFTCAHEAAHWILHRDVFFEGLLSENEDILTDKYNDGGQENIAQDKRMEWQANYLGAALLMPREMIRKEFFKMLGVLGMENRVYLYLDNQRCNFIPYKHIINRIVNVFNVSEQAARIRLIQLGMLVDERSY